MKERILTFWIFKDASRDVESLPSSHVGLSVARLASYSTSLILRVGSGMVDLSCPRPDIQGFLTANSHHSSDGKVPSAANSFLDVVLSGATHSNEHVVKTQRTLAHSPRFMEHDLRVTSRGQNWRAQRCWMDRSFLGLQD